MNRYAIVLDGVVSNIIVWDGVAVWSPPVGSVVVALDADQPCDIGWTYDPKESPPFAAPVE
jgi:hypothetical protein